MHQLISLTWYDVLKLDLHIMVPIDPGLLVEYAQGMHQLISLTWYDVLKLDLYIMVPIGP